MTTYQKEDPWQERKDRAMTKTAAVLNFQGGVTEHLQKLHQLKIPTKTVKETPVLCQEQGILISTFHPELTEDLTIHKYFIENF